MEAAGSPLVYRLLSILGEAILDLSPHHEGLQNRLIDWIVCTMR
jgi:hypothetical protein